MALLLLAQFSLSFLLCRRDVPPDSWYRRLSDGRRATILKEAKIKQFAFNHESDFLDFFSEHFAIFHPVMNFYSRLYSKILRSAFKRHQLHARRYLMKAWTSNKYVLSLGIAIGCDRVMRWWWVGERISEQRKKYYQNVSISIWLLNLELLLLPLVLLLKRARYICGFWFACRSVSLNLMVLYFFKEREEGWGW